MTKGLTWVLLIVGLAASVFSQGQLVGEIVVRGNKSVSEAVVLSVIGTKVGQIYNPQQLVRDKSLLEATGKFQEARVYGQLLENGKWRVVIEVVEWPAITAIRVSGNTVVSSESIVSVLANKVGEVFNPNSLESDARAVQSIYQSAGYFARVVRYEPSAQEPGVVVIEVAETRINKIEIRGLTRTRPSVVQRVFDSRSGMLLNYDLLNDDLKRLVDTRWFESIKPDTMEPEVGKVDIIVDLKETRTGTFNVGVQLDPRNRLAGVVSLNDNNFNGSGKTVGVSLVQSAQGLGTSGSLEYGDPFFDSKRTSLNTSVFSRESLVFGQSLFGSGGSVGNGRFSQRRTGFTINISKPVTKETRFGYGVESQHINTKDFIVDPGEEFVFQDGILAALNLSWTRNRRDFNQEPAKGDWFRITAQPSYADITAEGGQNTGSPNLGSTLYGKFSLDYRSYYSKAPRRTVENFDEPRSVLATRVMAGTIVGDPPFTDQFFVGGANGVRGYAEDRFWGNTMFMVQAELRYPIQKSFYAIAFVDYGGAWNGYPGIKDFDQTNTVSLKLGYGLGVNFRTPFGPIRLDLGFDDKGRPRTHFLIGGSF